MIVFVFLFCLFFRWGVWTGCYWWLGDAVSCIQVVSFLWVRAIWYSLRPGGLPSMGSHRVGHDWSDLAAGLVPEKAMATHSSTLAWKIPWTEEPGRLQSMGSLRVRCNWMTSLSLFNLMNWRRKWQPTPVFLPGESQGRWSLLGCPLWGCTELDTTEVT